MVVSDSRAVLAVLDRFRAGWEARDAAAVLDCFARDSEVTVIGTDAGEWWAGHAALVGPFQAMADAFSDLVYRWQAPPHLVVHGEVAWAEAMLDTELTSADGRMAVSMRTSWVLRRSDRWQIVQAHFSVAPPAPIAAY